MSIDEYFEVMDMTMIQAYYNENKETTMARFLNCLKRGIADGIKLQYVNSARLVKLDVRTEKKNKTR